MYEPGILISHHKDGQRFNVHSLYKVPKFALETAWQIPQDQGPFLMLSLPCSLFITLCWRKIIALYFEHVPRLNHLMMSLILHYKQHF